MKFWQKAFVILLIVFVITIDICAVVMMHFTYDEQMSSLKKKSSGEAYFISTSVSNDLYSVEPSGSIGKETRDDLFQTYMSYYEKQGILLSFYQGGKRVKSNFPVNLFPQQEHLEEGKQYISIVSKNEEKYLCVESQLLEPYEEYGMIYAYNLTEIEVGHQRLVWLTSGMVILITILLAMILSFILQKLTRPLKKLEERTLAIGQGDYKEKLLIEGEDEFALLAKSFNDMSEKINDQIMALKEEDRKKQLLIDNMAHEFRTPLTSIAGYASYLKMAAASEDEKLEALEYIMSEADRLQKLSKIILRSAEIREEVQQFESVKVEELLEKVKDSTLIIAEKEGCQMSFAGKVEEIKGNSALLESLLINLVENSIRACEEGSGKILVEIGKGEEGTYLKVKDNGIGMAREEIEKIAEPFYRIDKARSRKAGGVGLGVSLCQQIVAIHKGKLTYESEIGEGTTAYVSLFCRSL